MMCVADLGAGIKGDNDRKQFYSYSVLRTEHKPRSATLICNCAFILGMHDKWHPQFSFNQFNHYRVITKVLLAKLCSHYNPRCRISNVSYDYY